MPVITTDSYPGNPEPAIVGKSGSKTDGSALVKPKALNLPPRTCGMTPDAAGKASCTSPLINAMVAGPLPR